MLSNFEIKFLIILILVEILDPPIMQVTGLVILDVIFFNSSRIIFNSDSPTSPSDLAIS